MPQHIIFVPSNLDEAIKYYNDWYERVKNTKEIASYNEELYRFLRCPLDNDKIRSISSFRYHVQVQKSSKGGFYRMWIRDDNPSLELTLLSSYQIQELKRFLAYIESDEVKKSLDMNNSKSLFFLVIIVGIIALVSVFAPK